MRFYKRPEFRVRRVRYDRKNEALDLSEEEIELRREQ